MKSLPILDSGGGGFHTLGLMDGKVGSPKEKMQPELTHVFSGCCQEFVQLIGCFQLLLAGNNTFNVH